MEKKNAKPLIKNIYMKKWDPKLTIKRLSVSPYFPPQFRENEIKRLTPYAEMLPVSSMEASDILITDTHTPFDFIDDTQIKKLKLILHPNSGYDNISLEFIKKIKAPIILGNTIRAHAVSQYILGAFFQHYSSIPSHQTWDDKRQWPRLLISQLRILVIGFGHIGNILVSALSPLVKEVNIFDPYKNYPSLDYINADTIIFACSLNSTNHHMLNKKIFETLNKNVLLINAARGELINTKDLIAFLSQNKKAFAFLDVFEKEPNSFLDFINLENIHLTSHIAGVSHFIDSLTLDFEETIIGDFLELPLPDFKIKYKNILLQNRFHPEIGLI